MNKKQQRRIKRCYWRSGNPKRCLSCFSPDLVEDVQSSLDVGVGCGLPMEIETIYNKCGQGCAYWAYGYYDPYYLMDRLGVSDNERLVKA